MPNNSLITLLGTDLTTNNVGREVERPTQAQTPIEKKINYQLLYKMVEKLFYDINRKESNYKKAIKLALVIYFLNCLKKHYQKTGRQSLKL